MTGNVAQIATPLEKMKVIVTCYDYMKYLALVLETAEMQGLPFVLHSSCIFSDTGASLCISLALAQLCAPTKRMTLCKCNAEAFISRCLPYGIFLHSLNQCSTVRVQTDRFSKATKAKVSEAENEVKVSGQRTPTSVGLPAILPPVPHSVLHAKDGVGGR